MLDMTLANNCGFVQLAMHTWTASGPGIRFASTSSIDTPGKSFSDLEPLVLGVSLDPRFREALEVAYDKSDLPYWVDIAALASLGPEFRAIGEQLAVEMSA